MGAREKSLLFLKEELQMDMRIFDILRQSFAIWNTD